MPVYSVSGNELNAAYSVHGANLPSVFNVSGVKIDLTPVVPVTPLDWNMSVAYKAQVLDALDAIKSYKTSHPGSYAICQFNDVHLAFGGNEPNFIDCNYGYQILSRMLFLGDMVDAPSATTVQNAVNFIEGAQVSKRLVSIGNHEFQWTQDKVNAETIYRNTINVQTEDMLQDKRALIYYNDDEEHNVRYIVLDTMYITQSINSHKLGVAQLDWCASAMESAGSKDIILCCHTDMRPFTLVNNGVEITTATELKDQADLVSIISTFIARGMCTINEQIHDFSECTGNFIMYTSGHYHVLGHANYGFNAFTGPSLKYTNTSGQSVGFLFYIIDPQLKAIKAIMCSKKFTQYAAYDFSYDPEAET